MTFKWASRKDFAGYIRPLRSLERAFNEAGLRVEFILTHWPGEGKAKAVVINYFGDHSGSRCIEGDSPAQAVKDVSEFVDIWR